MRGFVLRKEFGILCVVTVPKHHWFRVYLQPKRPSFFGVLYYGFYI